jgi:hypothetical protein
MDIDLKEEQEATHARPPRQYGAIARSLFRGMDFYYGKDLSLGKMRLLEILARIPYQAWEIRQYRKLNRRFSDPGAVNKAEDIIEWSREAQDNEFWHLQVINEKIHQDGVRLNLIKDKLLPAIAVFKYNLFSRILAFISMHNALLLNADFEDHAEHEYMRYVHEHPELDDQPVGENPVIARYGMFTTWGDVFRRIGLDERDHMNNSLVRCGRKSEVAPYAGWQD